jgi:nitrite reductase (NO-forming)
LKQIAKILTIVMAAGVFALVLASLLVGGSDKRFSLLQNGGTQRDQHVLREQQQQLRDILLIADENRLMVAPDNDLHPGGVWYNAMTFNGTIPGPAIFVNQGDVLRITLRNQGEVVHSLNFHAGFGPSQALSGSVRPQENRTWTLKADYPGAFLYHCDGDNLNGIWEHIASGMYGAMVIRAPEDGEKPTKEFYVVFGELYDTALAPDKGPFTGREVGGSNISDNNTTARKDDGIASSVVGSFDIEKFIDGKPDLILTNGIAYRYMPWIGTDTKVILNKNAESFHVKVGEFTRWYIFNAGPRDAISFNFGAGLLRIVGGSGSTIDYNGLVVNGSKSNLYKDVTNIPPGSSSVIDVVFPEAGTYFGNDHDVGSLLYGAGFVVRAEN